MQYCGMCGTDLNLQLAIGCRRLLDPLPIPDLANQTYLHSLLTVLTDADCYEGELSGDGTLCYSCTNSLEQLEHLQRQVRQLVDLILNCYQQRYRNRRRPHNGLAEGGGMIKLEDVKEEDTKDDIKDGMGGGDLVECETLLTVAKVKRAGGSGKRKRQKRFLGNYRCELCYAPFYRQRDLEEHMELVHGPAGKEMILRSITCDICKKKLKTRRLLARHKFKVHRLDVPVPCLPCGIELKCESEYSKHLKDVHNSNVVCELCGKSFVSKHHLAVHTKHFHEDTPDTPKDMYVCDVCSSTYRNKGNLKIHMRRHESKNMFQCEYCDKSFKWDSSLNSHIQAAHNPTGPVFPCDLCDRVFKDKNNQKKHRFTHSNVKPFECKECGKGFIRRDLCAKHKCGNST